MDEAKQVYAHHGVNYPAQWAWRLWEKGLKSLTTNTASDQGMGEI